MAWGQQILCCFGGTRHQSPSNSVGHHQQLPSNSVGHAQQSPSNTDRRRTIEGLFHTDAPETTSLTTLFQTVRILVVGKSGSGKTTLIRLLLGDNGPQDIGVHGLPVQHDIDHEWLWTAHDRLPLVIHDSNGLDVASGHRNLETVGHFISDRQNRADLSSRIHLIWYVIGANDSRIAADGDLMKVVSQANAPILLIQTYNDVPLLVKNHVTGTVLDNLFKSLPPDLSGEIRRRMVPIGNNVRIDEQTGKIVGDIDYDGLIKISQKSLEILDKHLRYTWIASQVVDLETKLEATVGLIIETSKRALTKDMFRLKPDISLSSAFELLQERICRIWRVPDGLGQALSEIIMKPQLSAAVDAARQSAVERRGRDLMRFLAFVVSLGATEVTLRLSVGPLLAGEIRLRYEEEESKRKESNWTWRILTCGVWLLLSVLFVLSQQPEDVRRQNRWRSEDDYGKLCRDFEEKMTKEIHPEWAKKLQVPWVESWKAAATTSSTDKDFLMKFCFQRKQLSDLLADFAVDHYQLFLLNRPSSLHSQFQKDPVDIERDGQIIAMTRDDVLQLSFLDDNSIFPSND